MTGASDALMLLRVGGSLLAVVALALLVARFAKRTGGRHGTRDLRVCERVGLTRDTAAVVLEADGRRLLVGVGPAQITLLADLGAATTIDGVDGFDTVDGDVTGIDGRPGTVGAIGTAGAAGAVGALGDALARLKAGRTARAPRPGEESDDGGISPLDSLDAMMAGSPAATVAALPRQATGSAVPAGAPGQDTAPLLPRRVARELDRTRRVAVPPSQRGTGSVLDPRTWQQSLEALRDLTARRK